MRKSLVVLLSLSIAACGQSATTKQNGDKEKPAPIHAAIPGWKTVDKPDYALQYPPEWELNESGQMGTSLLVFAPLSGPEDKFRENINLLIQDLGSTSSVDLDQYASLSEAQVKDGSIMPNSKLLANEKIGSGKDAYYRASYIGDQSNLHLKFEAYYWVRNNKAYVLTFSAEASKFDEYKTTAENILNSFVLKN
jgi:hypothetical protein